MRFSSTLCFRGLTPRVRPYGSGGAGGARGSTRGARGRPNAGTVGTVRPGGSPGEAASAVRVGAESCCELQAGAGHGDLAPRALAALSLPILRDFEIIKL